MATPVALGPPSGPQKDAPRKAKKASYGPGVSKTLSGKFQARIVLDGKRYDLGSNFATADDAAAAHRTAKCAGRTDRPSPKHERVQRGTGTPLLLLTSIPFLCSMLVVATRMTFGRNEGAQSVLHRCDATAHHARVLASKYYNEPARTITRHTTTTTPPVFKTVPLLATGAPRPLGQLPQAIAQMPRAPMAVLTRAPVLASAVACTAMMSHARSGR